MIFLTIASPVFVGPQTMVMARIMVVAMIKFMKESPLGRLPFPHLVDWMEYLDVWRTLGCAKD